MLSSSLCACVVATSLSTKRPHLGVLVGGAVGAFVFLSSFVVWLILKITVGIRLSPDAENVGGDLSELGHPAGSIFAAIDPGKPAAPAE